jgi:hypothetical protein
MKQITNKGDTWILQLTPFTISKRDRITPDILSFATRAVLRTFKSLQAI